MGRQIGDDKRALPILSQGERFLASRPSSSLTAAGRSRYPSGDASLLLLELRAWYSDSKDRGAAAVSS